jgi:putative phosphoribosyl transferase
MEQQIRKTLVQIRVEAAVDLEGNLSLPDKAQGIVLFAHGSGSSRHSPRNQFVATSLNVVSLGTLLIDLLTPQEEKLDIRTASLRFNIDLLAQRLTGAIDWLTKQDDTRPLNIGLFGASTGAGAALVAAARRSSLVSAVVSRGGRPDLAGDSLSNVQAPTLLIVGENDPIVIDLNQQALQKLVTVKALEIVPRASHLFEESGTLEMVARLARKWFLKYLIEPRSDAYDV